MTNSHSGNCLVTLGTGPHVGDSSGYYLLPAHSYAVLGLLAHLVQSISFVDTLLRYEG